MAMSEAERAARSRKNRKEMIAELIKTNDELYAQVQKLKDEVKSLKAAANRPTRTGWGNPGRRVLEGGG